MTVIYSNSFDSETTGQLPSGWANVVGTWAVGTTNPVSGKDLEGTSNGDIVLFNGKGALGRASVSYQFRRGSAPQARLDAIYRSDAAFNNAYRVNFSCDGTNLTVYKRLSGNYTQIAAPGNFSLSSSSGDVIAVEAAANGSDHAVRIWNATTGNRPSDPTFAFSDGDITSGYPGVCLASTQAPSPFLDNFSIDDQLTATGVSIDRLSAGLFFSPYNWHDDGTSMNTNCTGAYLKTTFTGTSIGLTTVALPSGLTGYPVLRAIVDGGPTIDITLTSGNTAFAIASGLSGGNHTLELTVVSLLQQDDYWDLTSAVKIKALTLDTGATVSAPALRSKRAIVYGDSIPQGYGAPGASVDATLTWVPAMMQELDCEYGTVCYGGQGYTQANSTSHVPAVSDAYGLYSAGVSRLTAGVLSPAPDFLFDAHGTNPQTGAVPTQANIQSQNTSWRTIAPSATIVSLIPMGGYARAAKTAAAAAASDTKIALIDAGSTYDTGLNQPGTASAKSVDGLHPYARIHARFAAKWAALTQHALEPRKFTVSAS